MRQRGFRRLLTVRLTAQVGDGLFQAGLAGSVLFNPQKAASPMAIAAAFAIILLPYSLIGPYIGVLLDRWSRRTLMTMTNLIRAALLIPTAALIWSGSQNPAFMVLALVIIGLGRLFVAAVSAALPHVVDDHNLVTANATVNTLGSLGYSLGLGTVAVLVMFGLPATFHGYAIAASLAPVGFLASAIAARSSYNETELGPDVPLHRHVPMIRAIGEVGNQTADGFRHLATRYAAAYPLVAQSAHRILYGVLALAVTLRCRSAFTDHGDLSSSISGIGGVFAAGAVGTLIAAFITPAITRRMDGWRWIVALLCLTGVVVATFGIPNEPAMLPLAVGWVGVAAQSTKIVVDTALQHELEDEYRGRAFSINDTLFNLSFVAGTYAGAVALPESGRAPAVMVSVGVAYALIAACLAVASRRASRSTEPTKVLRVVVPAARDARRPRMATTGHESRWASAR